ncbi:hypothetical protein jhhlp_002963 [Lomentospora prolificans]|uniref:N-acetyltransferase ESCO zinc-finger domain-containing protein n=1 Tax=Lomentospora prolificans TaxID=41688 RepID=A0A2N3NFQ3_9PEZI|nr:hypothetical protein jhhlp_002963 [Lomentospora prolificans]
MAPIPVNDTTQSLLDAPPSSPEFIMFVSPKFLLEDNANPRSKKPHDKPRLRPKQWQRDITSTRTASMTPSENAANRRVIRTYSKRNSSVLSSSPMGPLAKRQKSNSITVALPSTEPVLPPAPAPAPKKMAGAGQRAIDGYFSTASSSSRSSNPSGRGLLSSDAISDDVTASPPSSPPIARKWTSPRRLKIRPSLMPISGEQEKKTGAKSVDGDVNAESERHRAQDSFFKPRIRDLNAHSTEDSSKRATRESRQTKDVVGCQSENEAHHSVVNPPEEVKNSVPVYTMPYSFYLNAANSAAACKPAEASSTKKSAPGTRKVQTTLNLSTKLPFKECKLCDTVYNPLHPADVKLHQTRHSKVTGEGLAMEKRKGRAKQKLL